MRLLGRRSAKRTLLNRPGPIPIVSDDVELLDPSMYFEPLAIEIVYDGLALGYARSARYTDVWNEGQIEPQFSPKRSRVERVVQPHNVTEAFVRNQEGVCMIHETRITQNRAAKHDVKGTDPLRDFGDVCDELRLLDIFSRKDQSEMRSYDVEEERVVLPPNGLNPLVVPRANRGVVHRAYSHDVIPVACVRPNAWHQPRRSFLRQRLNADVRLHLTGLFAPGR